MVNNTKPHFCFVLVDTGSIKLNAHTEYLIFTRKTIGILPVKGKNYTQPTCRRGGVNNPVHVTSWQDDFRLWSYAKNTTPRSGNEDRRRQKPIDWVGINMQGKRNTGCWSIQD